VQLNDSSKDTSRQVERAAITGDAKAQFQLGEMYQSGIGRGQNFTAAYRCFLRSAEQEYAPAELELALIYLLGLGVERSPKDAAHYLVRASQRGFPQAQFVLGALLAEGKVFKHSVEQARYWLGAAQASGHEQAGTELKKLAARTPYQKTRLETPGAKPVSRSLDIVPSSLSEADRELAYECGVKAGRDCAKRGFGRYKRILARRARFSNELDLRGFLDAVYKLSVSSAATRGYFDPDCIDGVENICDGSHPNSTAYKAAFIDGVTSGLQAGVYGGEETEAS
jgi:hypothetical protein